MIMTVKKLFNNDYFLSLFNKIYSILIGVVSSAFYVRYLGLEFKGMYSYINEITTIIALIINFGIYQSYPFYYRRDGSSIYKKYVDIFIFQFLIYCIVSLAVGFVFGEKNTVTVLVCLQLPFFVLKTQLDNVVLVEKLRIYMMVDMILKTILSIVYFLLWMFAPVHISYVVITVASTNLLVSIVYLLFTDYKISIDILKPNIKFIREVMLFGFFPMLSTLLMTLNYSVDIIFLEKIGDPVELSLYSVAAVLINYVWIIPNAFKEVLISKVARSDAEDQVAFSCRISILITFICLIGFSAIGRFVVSLVFGNSFSGCYLVTLVLFIGAFSMIFFKMLGVVFVAEGKRKEYFVILLISVVINVLANYLLIPVCGMYGAAVASVASYTVCGISFLMRYCKWKETRMMNYLLLQKSDLLSIIRYFKKGGNDEKTGI